MRRRLLLVLAGATVLGASFANATDLPNQLDQGWSKEIRELFYFTPQGSRMIPYAWFMALERSDGPGMFADSENLQRYGFISADGPHPLNPDALPIGFAIDPGAPQRSDAERALGYSAARTASERRQLGLTCAACHTANVTVGSRPIRVDGAPAHLDIDTFYADLAKAVTQTLFDQTKFERFAARVLGPSAIASPADLKAEFSDFQTRIAGEAAIRRPAVASGFGRTDALTQIINSLAVRDQGDPANLRTPDAPTSYPALWLTPELEFVQWSPIAASPIHAAAKAGGRTRAANRLAAARIRETARADASVSGAGVLDMVRSHLTGCR